MNIVPFNIKPLGCFETSGINRPVTSRHIPRERRTPQEITELRVCRMFFWCVLMCKLSCGCVLLCKVSRSYFANGTLPLYASMHAILVFCFCNFRILFVCTRPCFCVFCVCAFIFLCLCICLCFLYVRVSAPFVNVMTKTIFFISRHKAGKMFVQGLCIYSCNFGLSYRPNI